MINDLVGGGRDRGVETFHFPYPALPLPVPLSFISRLPPFSVLLPSPVNLETQNAVLRHFH